MLTPSEKLQKLQELKDPSLKMNRILADKSIAEVMMKMETLQGIAGNDGYTPIRGKDYFTEQDINHVASIAQSMVKPAIDGKDGIQGIPGRNGDTPLRGVDYWTSKDQEKIIKEAVALIPKAKDGLTPDTKEVVNQAVAELKKQPVNFKDIKGTEELVAFLKLGGFRGGGGSSSGGVTSFNTRTGEVTLTSGDVTTALGFTPISNITGLISAGTDISITGSGTIASPYVINSVVGAGATLATVSAASTTTPNSLYTMTTAIPVEFKTSSGTHLLYLDEVNGRIGIRNAAPVSPLHVTGLADNTSTTALFEQNASGIGIIQLGNASPSQNAKFIFNFGGDNLLTIATNYSLGTNNAIAFSPGGTETVRFKQGGLNGFGTNAPTHTITLSSTATGIAAYNTTDQTTNYQRITAGWKSSVYEIGSFFGGSASDAMIRIGNNSSGGTTTVNRYFGINSSNATTAAAFDFITTAVSYTSANALMTNLANATFTASSGVQGIVGINPSITQTGSAGYQALWISPFEISTGSGVHYLIDAGTNSAANGSGTHTSKFNVDDTGAGSFASSLVIGSSITAGTTSSNIDISSSVSAITTAVSQYQFASSTTNFFRTGFYGNSPSVLSTGANYSGVIFGNAPIATFTSGTHNWLANVVIRPIGTVTNSGATVTNTASLYIDGFGAGGSNNYSFYVNGGTSVINGNLISTGTLNVNGTTTLATSLSGLLKASSGVVSVASAGTDYQAPITLTTTGTSGAATFIANTLNIPQYSGGSGGITRSVNVVSTATGAGSTAATDYIYLVSGTTTITLPTAVGNTNRYTVSRTDASLTTTIATTSAQTINGASTYTLLSQYASVDLISNGSNWLIV